MYGKFLLIALACVSVAQVHGSLTEHAISNALRKVSGIYEQANGEHHHSVEDYQFKRVVLELKNAQFVFRATNVRDSSRETIKKIADIVEEKAMENFCPVIVYECIKTNEDNANDEIESFTRDLLLNVDRLLRTVRENLSAVGKAYDPMKGDLEAKYDTTINVIKKCQNLVCVHTNVKSFTTFINSLLADIRRIEDQSNTILTNHQRDGDNYFSNFNKQVTRVRSTALKDINKCFYLKEDSSEDSQKA